jgi:NTP pyrophosphatase (non-canonical NTP hydrolase)
MEESGELAQAIGKFRGLSGEQQCLEEEEAMQMVARELVDVAQTAVTMMFVLEEQSGIDLEVILTGQTHLNTALIAVLEILVVKKI